MGTTTTRRVGQIDQADIDHFNDKVYVRWSPHRQMWKVLLDGFTDSEHATIEDADAERRSLVRHLAFNRGVYGPQWRP